MSKGDDPIDLFESTAWDDEGEEPHSDGAERPRWVIPAFVTVLALAVGGIAINVATDDENTSTRPTVVTQSTEVGGPNTVAQSTSETTVPRTLPEFPPSLFPTDPSATDGSLIPKYVIDVPAGLNVVESTLTRQPVEPARPELWAAPGSSARSGRWVTIERINGGASGLLVSPLSYRLSLPSIDAAVAPPTALRPTTQLVVQSNGDLLLAEAFGWGDSIPDLVAALATGGDDLGLLAVMADLRQLDAGSMNDIPALNSGRVLTIVGPIPADAITLQQTQLQLRVSLPALNNRRLEGFRLTDPQRLAIGDDTAAVAGNLARQPGFGSVTWLDRDGWELELTGTLPVGRLIELARTARVDDSLWDIFTTAASPRSPVSMTSSPAVLVASLPAGPQPAVARLTPYVDTVSNSEWLAWSLDHAGEVSPFIEADVPSVFTVVVDEATYVLAGVPASDASLTLRVTLANGEVRDTTLRTGTFGTLLLAVAAAAFDEAGPYSAAIIDATGSVLASWPAFGS